MVLISSRRKRSPMINDDQAKKALDELGLNAEEAKDVADITAMLLELAYDGWSEERKKTLCQQKTR